MIEITEWNERYECNSRGQEAKDGDELRVGPLRYIRLKTHGRRQGTGYRRMKALAGKNTMQVFGLFCKFLEIAGDQPKDLRGKLLNEHDEPATADDLAFMLDVPVQHVKTAIVVLSDKSVGWLINKENINQENINQENINQYNIREGAHIPPKLPGKSGKFKKPTPEEVVSYAKTIGYDLDGQRFCDYYESNGWKVGRNAMKCWKSAISTWKARDNGQGNNPQFNGKKTGRGFTELEYKGKNDDLTYRG